MKKNVIIGIIIVAIIVIAIVAVKSNKNNIDMSREEVLALVRIVNSKENIYFEYTTNGNKTTKKVKGDIEVIESNGTITWTDYKNKEKYIINTTLKTVQKLDDMMASLSTMIRDNSFGVMNYLRNLSMEYKCIGEEKIKKSKAIHIELKDSEDTINIWIEKETGAILKITKGENIQEFSTQFNVVKAEEVKLPDLSEYEDPITQIKNMLQQ